MICPKCGKCYPRLLALSRKDNKTMICDVCGMREAIAAIQGMIVYGKESKDEELQGANAQPKETDKKQWT